MNKKYYAFFDVDGTVINYKSMISFLKFIITQTNISVSVPSLIGLLIVVKMGFPREIVNKQYYKIFKNVYYERLMLSGKDWFRELITKRGLFVDETIEEIKKHKKNNGKVVFVTGSFLPCVEPIAKYLGADEVISTELELDNNKLTGKLMTIPNIGQGKVSAISKFLQKHNDVNKADCYAYGDHISDLPMLDFVGKGCVVGQDKDLASIAQLKNWKIIHTNQGVYNG